MANEVACHTDDLQRTDVPFLRWIVLAALVLIEILFLTLRFDSVTLADQEAWWARIIEHAGFAPQLVVIVLTATLVFGGAGLRAGLDELTRLTSQRHAWQLWCLIQLGLFVAFISITKVVFEGNADSSAGLPLWPLAWVMTALAIAITWLFAILPPSAWLTVLQRYHRPIAAGVGIGCIAWMAGRFSDRLWLPLGNSTLWLTEVLLRAVRADIRTIPDQMVIGTQAFAVEIAPACSGYEGLGMIWVFLGTYLWWSRRDLRWPQAWLLLPLATSLMWFLNSLRITGLILIGSYGWRDIALGGFHSQAGWLAFIAVALGLVALSQQSRFFSLSAADSTQPQTVSFAAPYLVPLMALVATQMITGALVSDVDWLYPVRVVAVAIAVLWYARCYATWDWSWSWGGIVIGVAAFGLWMALEPLATHPPRSDALAGGLASMSPIGAAGWLFVRVAGSVVAAPLAEELAFRGYLTRRLLSADFTTVPASKFSWIGLLVSSALFGALHPGRWLAGTLSGVLFGIALYRRGNLLDAVLAHAVTNALIAIYVLSTGNWNLWS